MKRWTLLLLAGALAGCAHSAAQDMKPAPLVKAQLTPDAVARDIIKGKTSKDEVIARFGPPNSIAKNTRLPSPEQMAKVKGPLPPVARTVEFWNYWTIPPQQEVEKSAATGAATSVFRLMLFIDKNGVVTDYLSETRKMSFLQERG